MDYDDIIHAITITIIIFMFLWFIFIDNRLNELENKISDKCIYINEKYYCES